MKPYFALSKPIGKLTLLVNNEDPMAGKDISKLIHAKVLDDFRLLSLIEYRQLCLHAFYYLPKIFLLFLDVIGTKWVR